MRQLWRQNYSEMVVTNNTNGQKPVVGFLRSPFLPISETFIYRYLVSLNEFRPVVLTMAQENLDVFPFPDVHLLTIPRPVEVFWRRVLSFDSSVLKYSPWYPAHIQAIRQHQIGLLHAHFGTTGYFAWPLKRYLDMPLVTSFYGADVSRLGQLPVWQKRYHRLFSSGEHFTVTSLQMRSRLVELGCSEEKITHIGTGVNLKNFPYQPRQLPGSGEPVKFLMVGRFVEKKGIEYTLKAFASVHSIHPHTEFRLIGDGPLRPQIEGLIGELGIGDAVKLLGFQPTERFIEETKHCHIVLQPSVTASDGDQEGGAPMAMMEAQAAGMPFISTMHAGIHEEVLDGETGFLVPERDVEALTDKMNFFVEYTEVWNEMGLRARRHIEQNYSEQVQSRKLENVYHQALAAHKPGQSN